MSLCFLFFLLISESAPGLFRRGQLLSDLDFGDFEQGADDSPQHLRGLVVHFLQCSNHRIHTLFPVSGKRDHIIRLGCGDDLIECFHEGADLFFI